MKLRVAVYQCKNLPPADSNGTSDPYVQLINTSSNQKVKTMSVFDTNNPIFFQVLEIPFQYDTIERAMPIVLDLFDYDDEILDSTDDFMGRCVLFLRDKDVQSVLSNDQKMLVP